VSQIVERWIYLLVYLLVIGPSRTISSNGFVERLPIGPILRRSKREGAAPKARSNLTNAFEPGNLQCWQFFFRNGPAGDCVNPSQRVFSELFPWVLPVSLSRPKFARVRAPNSVRNSIAAGRPSGITVSLVKAICFTCKYEWCLAHQLLAVDCELDQRLMSRMNASLNPELKERNKRWGALTLGDEAIALATRMVAIDIATERLYEGRAALLHELSKNSSEVEACMREGAVYTPSDESRTYSILVDFDAFLFETRSAYEITVRFIHKFLSGILEKAMPQAKSHDMHDLVAREISCRGEQADWIQELGTIGISSYTRQHRGLLSKYFRWSL